MAGTGLPLVGMGLDEEPTIVPQRFIPVGPETGPLSGARSGRISIDSVKPGQPDDPGVNDAQGRPSGRDH